ncbi:MAG TPA: SGNH/GDSL hydrolase family protein [Amycolatopsis sp.]|nr:SGNH/GDSL hydrolase family protein [Amycolatopsis sp.]
MKLRIAGLALALAGLLAAGAPAAGASSRIQWVDAWAASPQSGVTGVPVLPDARPLDDQTVRLVVHPEFGGDQVRVTLSNAFGDRQLVVGAASIARRATGAAIDPAKSRPITFGGQAGVTIPVGAQALSDPVRLRVDDDADLAVDVYLPGPTGVPTWHFDAQQTSYTTTGDHVGAQVLPAPATSASWYLLTDVAVSAERGTEGIVALGDSITDGYGSTVDANHRWPNYLADRLDHRRLAVIDEGISAGRLLHDVVGPSALARFDRDVLAKPSARYVISLIGINDIGLPGAFGRPDEEVSAAEIEQGYRQLIARAHQNGLRIFAGTLLAIEGSPYGTVANEAKRQEVNAWLRGGAGGFDGIVDFDATTRDPAHPARLLPAYDSGDHIHPNDTGYQAMANAVNLHWFR